MLQVLSLLLIARSSKARCSTARPENEGSDQQCTSKQGHRSISARAGISKILAETLAYKENMPLLTSHLFA